MTPKHQRPVSPPIPGRPPTPTRNPQRLALEPDLDSMLQAARPREASVELPLLTSQPQ